MGSAEVADYKIFHIDGQFGDQRGGLHDAIEGCLVNNTNKRSYCGPTDLDTGAPGVQVAATDASRLWRPQTPVTFAFFDKGKPVIGAEFTVGRGPGARLSFRAPPRRPGAHIYLGILPYFAFSTLYDPEAKTLGLKARQGSAADQGRSAAPSVPPGEAGRKGEDGANMLE